MSADEKPKCEKCGSELLTEISGSLHCNQCGKDSPIVTRLYGTPLNPKRKGA